jgi:proline iminopeptidase
VSASSALKGSWFTAALASLCLVASAHATSGARRDTWYLPTADGKAKLFVEELGQNASPPVIVLHGGWGAEHSYLDDVMRAHTRKGFRFILYDQRGSLLSPTSDPRSLSLAQQVDDLEQLRRSLGLQRLTIFAHSMGTFLAMSYAQRYPSHVEKLIMTGTLPAKSPPGGWDAYTTASNSDAREHLTNRPEVARERQAVEASGDPIAARRATHLWRIGLAAVNMYHVERWRQMPGGEAFFNQVSADAIAPTMPATWDFEATLLGGIKVEVINGDHDYADFAQRYWSSFASKHLDIRLRVLRNAGHSAWLDDPKAFDSALNDALSE